MNATSVVNARFAAAILCSALALRLGLPERAEAVTITNYLGGYDSWPLYSLAINAGDTVVWLNQEPAWQGTNYVASYGGEWRSPSMSFGDSFSFTFTNAGFYAYQIGTRISSSTLNLSGTVTVHQWTGASPALTINTPVEDQHVLPSSLVQASATNAENLLQIDYFANSILMGTATNAPFGIGWVPNKGGSYVLIARATDRQGAVAWSQPVNVIEGPTFGVYGSRLLPTGELLFYYNSAPHLGM
jgi:plastocyanin